VTAKPATAALGAPGAGAVNGVGVPGARVPAGPGQGGAPEQKAEDGGGGAGEEGSAGGQGQAAHRGQHWACSPGAGVQAQGLPPPLWAPPMAFPPFFPNPSSNTAASGASSQKPMMPLPLHPLLRTPILSSPMPSLGPQLPLLALLAQGLEQGQGRLVAGTPADCRGRGCWRGGGLRNFHCRGRSHTFPL